MKRDKLIEVLKDCALEAYKYGSRGRDLDWQRLNKFADRIQQPTAKKVVTVAEDDALAVEVDKYFAAKAGVESDIATLYADDPEGEQLSLGEVNSMLKREELSDVYGPASAPEGEGEEEALYVLSEFIILKGYKDQHGKDDYYLSEQPKLWERAKQVILNIPPPKEAITKLR